MKKMLPSKKFMKKLSDDKNSNEFMTQKCLFCIFIIHLRYFFKLTTAKLAYFKGLIMKYYLNQVIQNFSILLTEKLYIQVFSHLVKKKI